LKEFPFLTTMMMAKTIKMPNSKMLACISDNHDEGKDNQDAKFRNVGLWENDYGMLKVRCRIQKCWPVRKWLWNVQSEMLQRWLDLVSVETIYIYLGIFRGRFCRFWERGLEVSKDGWTLFLSKLFISI
jgi:hypothetical protein